METSETWKMAPERETWERRLSHKDVQLKYSHVPPLLAPRKSAMVIAKFFYGECKRCVLHEAGVRREMKQR